MTTATEDVQTRLHDSFSLLFERSPMPMLVYATADYQLMACNSAALACYGYSREEFFRLQLRDLLFPDDWPRLVATLSEPEDQWSAYRVTRHRHRDGRAIDVEIDAETVELDGLRARMVMVRVMTHQRRAERAQLEAAGRLTATLDSIDQGFFSLDDRRCFSYVNRRAEEMWRIGRENLLGFGIWNKFPALVGSRFHQEYERAITTGASVSFEAFYEPLKLWLSVQAAAHHGHLHVYFRDITEHRLALQSLQRERETLSAVVNAANDAIVSTDSEGRIVMSNPSAERIFGYQRENLQRMSLEQLLPERDRLGKLFFLNDFVRTATDGLMLDLNQIKGLRADGREVDMEGCIRTVHLGDQKILIASLRDVTQQLRAQADRQQVQAQLSALAHKLMAQEKALVKGLAQTLHDQLGQTLAAVRMTHETTVLRRGSISPDELTKLDQQLSVLIQQAVRQVRQALVDLHPPLLDELGLTAALDNELRNRAPTQPQVRIVFLVRPAVAKLRWPPDVEYSFFMVAREAVDNALRHAEPANLTVQIKGSARILQLEVRDDGLGLPDGAVPYKPGHLGMSGMSERARAVKAELEVSSHQPNGTVVKLFWSEPACVV